MESDSSRDEDKNVTDIGIQTVACPQPGTRSSAVIAAVASLKVEVNILKKKTVEMISKSNSFASECEKKFVDFFLNMRGREIQQHDIKLSDDSNADEYDSKMNAAKFDLIKKQVAKMEFKYQRTNAKLQLRELEFAKIESRLVGKVTDLLTSNKKLIDSNKELLDRATIASNCLEKFREVEFTAPKPTDNTHRALSSEASTESVGVKRQATVQNRQPSSGRIIVRQMERERTLSRTPNQVPRKASPKSPSSAFESQPKNLNEVTRKSVADNTQLQPQPILAERPSRNQEPPASIISDPEVVMESTGVQSFRDEASVAKTVRIDPVVSVADDKQIMKKGPFPFHENTSAAKKETNLLLEAHESNNFAECLCSAAVCLVAVSNSTYESVCKQVYHSGKVVSVSKPVSLTSTTVVNSSVNVINKKGTVHSVQRREFPVVGESIQTVGYKSCSELEQHVSHLEKLLPDNEKLRGCVGITQLYLNCTPPPPPTVAYQRTPQVKKMYNGQRDTILSIDKINVDDKKKLLPLETVDRNTMCELLKPDPVLSFNVGCQSSELKKNTSSGTQTAIRTQSSKQTATIKITTREVGIQTKFKKKVRDPSPVIVVGNHSNEKVQQERIQENPPPDNTTPKQEQVLSEWKLGEIRKASSSSDLFASVTKFDTNQPTVTVCSVDDMKKECLSIGSQTTPISDQITQPAASYVTCVTTTTQTTEQRMWQLRATFRHSEFFHLCKKVLVKTGIADQVAHLVDQSVLLNKDTVNTNLALIMARLRLGKLYAGMAQLQGINNLLPAVQKLSPGYHHPGVSDSYRKCVTNSQNGFHVSEVNRIKIKVLKEFFGIQSQHITSLENKKQNNLSQLNYNMSKVREMNMEEAYQCRLFPDVDVKPPTGKRTAVRQVPKAFRSSKVDILLRELEMMKSAPL